MLSNINLNSAQKHILLPIIAAVVFLFLVFFSNNSYATNIGTMGHCKNVEPTSDSSYFNPRIKVNCRSSFLGTSLSYTAYLGIGECEAVWMPPILNIPARVCARIAAPEKFGNNTHLTANPRPQLCAYDDPVDPNDWDGTSQNFHEKTPREDAMTAKEGAELGLLVSSGPTGFVGKNFVGGTAGDVMMYVGAGFGGIAVAGVAAGMGATIAAIMEKYNHWVIGTLGCIDVPVGPLPPVWSNNAWDVQRLPDPKIEYLSTSTYERPTIQLTICKNSNTHKARRCVGNPIPSGEIAEIINLTPRPPTFISKYDPASDKTDADYYRVNRKDTRIFSASIVPFIKNKICIFQILNGDKSLIKCLKRDGQIPVPVVNNSSSTYTSPNITVTMGKGRDAQSITLAPDPSTIEGSTIPPTPGWSAHEGYLYQHKFTAFVPCVTLNPNGSCAQRANQICVNGYEGPTGIATKPNLSLPLNQQTSDLDNRFNVQRAPHADKTKLPSIWEYKPLVDPATIADVNRETKEVCELYSDLAQNNSTSKCTTTSTTATNCKCPRKCYEVDNTGACVNTSGECENQTSMVNGICQNYKNHLSSDPYQYNQTTHFERPLTAKELGLCVGIPPKTTESVYTTPGTYTYVVPNNCKSLWVKMYGGGGAGNAGQGGDTYDGAGGSGAYASVQFSIDPTINNKLELKVAHGSDKQHYPNKADGEDSIFYVTKDKTKAIIAGGGKHGVDPNLWNGAGPNPMNGRASNGTQGNGGTLRYTGNWSNLDWIQMPQARHGVSGEHNGSFAKGPAGGFFARQQCYYPFSRPAPSSSTRNDQRSGIVDNPFPYQPTTPDGEQPAGNIFNYQPGAGGCSFDDPSHEPYGEGGHGEVRVRCLQNNADPIIKVGLRLWLDAENPRRAVSNLANNTKMSLWEDLSGNDNDVIQNLQNHQPTLLTGKQNGKNVVKFSVDPSASPLSFNYMTTRSNVSLSVNGLTAFIAAKIISHHSYSDEHFYMGYKDGPSKIRFGNKMFQSTPGDATFNQRVKDDKFSIVTYQVSNAGDFAVRSNGKVLHSVKLANANFSQDEKFWIGSTTSQGDLSFNGEIGEILVYGQQISPTAVSAIETALSTKWGITANYDPSQSSGLQLWFDAQDVCANNGNTCVQARDGIAVNEWINKADPTDKAIQNASNEQPIYRASAINNYPALEFDGIDDRLYIIQPK